MEIVRTYQVQAGDIISGITPEKSLEYMIEFHKHGIESRLHSYWNGHECTALEIVSLPKGSLTVPVEMKRMYNEVKE